MRVLVAGGGIGGLATALSLHEAGIEVEVVESARAASRPTARASTSSRTPSASSPSSASARSSRPPGSRRRSSSTTTASAAASTASRAGSPPATAGRSSRSTAASCRCCCCAPSTSASGRTRHVRAGLRALRAACRRRRAPGARPRDGARCARSRPTCSSAPTGSTRRSARSCIPDEGAGRWSGVGMWRGVSEAEPFLSGRTMIMAGSNRREKFVAYPIRGRDGRRLVNWVAEVRVAPDDADRRRARLEARRATPRPCSSTSRLGLRLARRAGAHRRARRRSSSTRWSTATRCADWAPGA